MSTSLEDLPIEAVPDNVSEEDQEYEEDEENKGDYQTDAGTIAMIFEKIKEPVLVSLLVFLFSNPFFLSTIQTIPYAKDYSVVSINIAIAILAGGLFFVLKELS
jgi:hypothetical protein